MQILSKGIKSLAAMLDAGEITCRELVQKYVLRAKELNPVLNSFITICEESAASQAMKADEERKRGSAKRLLGIPIALKDNIVTEGIKTTCASKMLADFIPPYDATAVKRLKREGAIIIGKTNMDEFAMGSSTEHSYFGAAKNPWDINTVPGGSSGGSAACVAARQACAALGSDTGGSVRQPASFCGTVGLKPTYGRISRSGLVAFASSLDQIGILTAGVEDCALISEIIFGHDQNDSTSSRKKVPEFCAKVSDVPKALRLGFVREHFTDGLESEVKDAFFRALKHLEAMGFSVEEISLPNSEYSIATYYVIANAEASANLARYDGVRYGYRGEGKSLKEMYMKTRSEGFGTEVKRRIMLGTFVLSSGYYDAYYARAQKVRTLISRDYKRAFEKVDVLLSPTSPTCAFKLGEKLNDPLQMYLCDIYTTSVNLAGLPALSLPCGFSKEGLPIGLQLVGRHFDEETLLKVALRYENTTAWKEKRPSI